ncbi:MAG: hypothetical protein AAB481_04220 [Patescibacteria group bacterium]
MAETLNPLSGMPLNEVIEALARQGLAVEGAHANGVSCVSVTNGNGESVWVPVKPVVVWDSSGEPTTLYYPQK